MSTSRNLGSFYRTVMTGFHSGMSYYLPFLVDKDVFENPYGDPYYSCDTALPHSLFIDGFDYRCKQWYSLANN